MKPTLPNPIAPGTMVRVEQRIMHGTAEYSTTVEGEVISHDLEPTGSWYTRGHQNKLWLTRLRIKKSDGEITALNLDSNATVTITKKAP